MDILFNILLILFVLVSGPVFIALRVASWMSRENFSKRIICYFIFMYYGSLTVMYLVNVYIENDWLWLFN